MHPVDIHLHHGPLRRLRQECDARRALRAQVRALLPPNLAPHLRAAGLRDQCLTLHAGSPAWASRIRYLSRSLRQRLSRKGVPVKEIRVRVLLDEGPRSRRQPAPSPRRLPPVQGRLLTRLAEGLNDPDQVRILRRIGERLMRP